jgi:CRP/FNR family transcriptional regulator, cyclic AMP receptor protein
MTFPAAIGFLASALVFATFWMKAPIRLRQVGIASNVVFFSYGMLAGAYPVAVLHALLFPLNIVRLIELERLTAKVKAALSSDLSPEWLRPFTSSKDSSRGDCLFRKGDVGSEAYFIVSGQVQLPEIDLTLSPGALLGEMALFTPGKHRNLTAECITDVEALVVSNESLSKLYYQNPDFAVYLLRLITTRLVSDITIWERRWLARE